MNHEITRRPLRPEELFDEALILKERAEKAEAEVARLRGLLKDHATFLRKNGFDRQADDLMRFAPAPEEPAAQIGKEKWWGQDDWTGVATAPAPEEPVSLDPASKVTHEGNVHATDKQTDWRELGPDDLICDGDKYRSDVSFTNWPVSSVMIGKPARNFPEYSFRTSRPLLKQEEMPLEDEQIEPLFGEEVALIEKWGCSKDPFRSVHAQEAFVHVIHAFRCLENEIQQHEDMFTTWIKATEDQRLEIRYLRDEVQKLKEK